MEKSVRNQMLSIALSMETRRINAVIELVEAQRIIGCKISAIEFFDKYMLVEYFVIVDGTTVDGYIMRKAVVQMSDEEIKGTLTNLSAETPFMSIHTVPEDFQ